MLPHSHEFPPEGTKEMATTPEALNLVKSDKSNREESAAEGSRDPSPTTRESAERGAAQGTQEDSRISDSGDAKRPEAEEAERAATASSRGSSRHSAGLASGEPMEGAVLHTLPSEEKTTNDSVGCTQSSAVLGAVVNTSDNGTFSDEEYIDVVSLDPAEEQSHSSVDESRIQTERDRLVVENSRPFGEICTFVSAPQAPRKSNVGGRDRAATEEDRVPSLDSGCYSDDEMRVRARRASAEWSDVAGEKKAAAHQNLKPVHLPHKEAFSEKGTVRRMSPPQPDLISSGTDSRQVAALQPVKPIYAPDKEAFSQKGLHRTSPPSTDLLTPGNYSQQMMGYTSKKYDYPCLQSYGKHTLYNPPEASLPQIAAARGTECDGMPPGRNSTEVVYTFDTSSVRMSTGTSLVGPSHEQRVNSTVDPGTSRSKGTLASIVLDKTKTDKDEFNTDRRAMNSETLMGVKSTVSATSVKQISSQSPDRAEIISIPSKKSAFVTAAHTTAQDVALMSVNGPETSTMLHMNVRQGLNFSRSIPYSLEGIPFKPLASGYYPGRILIPNNSLNQQLFREESALGHVTDRKAVVPASAFHMDNSDTAWSVMNPFEQKMVTPETPRKGSKRRSRKIVDVAANTNVNEEPLEKVPRLSYPNILHPPVSEQPYFPVLRSAISSTGLQNVPATTTQRPMAYRSEILKSYLKGEQVINDATGVPFKALRPTEAPATNTSHNVMIRDQVKVSAVNETNSRDRLHGSEQPKRVNENREQQPIHKIEKRAFDVGRLLNLEENGSLDLRKKHAALSMGGPQSEAVARLAQMRDQCLPRSTDFRLAMKSVPKNGSVIVPTSGDQGERVNSGVDPSTARSVIVSSVSRKVSSAEVRLVDAAAVGTAPLPTPTALDASTVLAYEPSGRESRYVVTRQGSGNSFVIREVGSLSEPPAAKREVARRGRGEADTAGVLVAQGSGHSRAPMQQEARGARGGGMSVIRTAPAEDADDDVQVLEVYRRPGSFEPTGSERPWADAEFSAASAGGLPGDEAYAGGGAAAADRALRLRLWVVLWALLGGERLRAVGWPRAPVRRVLWRAVDVCCSAAGAKSAAAVPLPADHDCGADMACFRDHAHRLLEVCAPTRDHWKRYGWASLTVDAVVAKVYREDILPWLRSLRPEVIPEAVRDSLRLLQCMETARERGPPPPAPLVLRPAPAPEAAPSLPPAPPSSQPPAAASTSSASGVQEGTRKKRGRPAKQASSADAGTSLPPPPPRRHQRKEPASKFRNWLLA